MIDLRFTNAFHINHFSGRCSETYVDRIQGKGNRHPRGVHIEFPDLHSKTPFCEVQAYSTDTTQNHHKVIQKNPRHNAAEHSINYFL